MAYRTLIVVISCLALLAIGTAAVRIFVLPAKLWTWGPSIAEMFWQLRSLSDQEKLALDDIYRQSGVALSVFADMPELRDEYDYVLSRRSDFHTIVSGPVDQARTDATANRIALDLIWRLEPEYVVRAPTNEILEYFRQKLSLLRALYAADPYSQLCDAFVYHLRWGEPDSIYRPYYENITSETFHDFFEAFNEMVRAARNMPHVDIDAMTQVARIQIVEENREAATGEQYYTLCESEMNHLKAIFHWVERSPARPAAIGHIFRADQMGEFRKRAQHPYNYTPFDRWRIVL